jgi:hypothetical protein
MRGGAPGGGGFSENLGLSGGFQGRLGGTGRLSAGASAALVGMMPVARGGVGSGGVAAVPGGAGGRGMAGKGRAAAAPSAAAERWR